MQLGGDIIVLDEGRVLQQGPAHEIFENPANTRVAEISNDPAMNLLPGAIEDGKIVISGDLNLPVPAHFKSLTPGTYTFGIRASDVSLDDKGLAFNVELAEIRVPRHSSMCRVGAYHRRPTGHGSEFRCR